MKSQDRRYPIGQFEYGKTYSLNDTRKHIRAIAKLPKELKKALKKLKSGELDQSYRRGGWTARQVIHHIVDSHMNAYIRMKLAVTEPTPIIKPYEEKYWAETEDGKNAPVKLSLKILAPLHRRWVMFLESLSEEDLEKGYFHPEMKRVISLSEAIANYAWHGRHHTAHIRLVADGRSEKSEKAEETTARKTRRPRAQKDQAADTKAAAVPAKRKRRSSAEVAAEKAAKAAAPKLSRAEILAKARAARSANVAAKVPAAPKKSAAAPARKRRSSAEVAAEKAAKAAAPKLSRAEVLAKARAARAAKSGSTSPKKAAKSDGPKLSRAEILAKARAARAANIAAKKAPESPKTTAAKSARNKKK